VLFMVTKDDEAVVGLTLLTPSHRGASVRPLLSNSLRQMGGRNTVDTGRTMPSAVERPVFGSLEWRSRPRLCENVNRSRTSLSMQKTF